MQSNVCFICFVCNNVTLVFDLCRVTFVFYVVVGTNVTLVFNLLRGTFIFYVMSLLVTM